jgi:pyruvate dehydrogenase E2 component (dihydrolipoamide acetyltransferase)
MATLKPFTMPKWGIEMAEGTIAEWGVEEGQPFTRGTVLALVETDKITNEIEAEADGRFVRLIAGAGETHPVGALLAVLSDGGEASEAEIAAVIANFRQADTSFGDAHSSPAAPSPAMPARAAMPIPDAIAISPQARAVAAAAGIDVSTLAGTGRKGRITAQDIDQAVKPDARPNLRGAYPPTPSTTAFASPLARRLGHLHGLDLSTVTGSGPKGRIRKADVLAAVEPAEQPPARRAAAPAPGQSGKVEIVPMTAMRRTIARRLTEAKQTIPHFYLRRRVRMDRLAALRSVIEGQRPTLNDYLVKACALALMEVPQANIQVHGDDIHRFADADIAVAVATERGLMTPIVRAAQALSVGEISRAVADLAQRARSGRLSQHEISGGSFSLSNLGGHGIEQFDAIINPPQGAILAVGAARSEPIDDDGAIRLVPMMHMSLSCDHRAIDGADGARFMAALVALIEAPHLLD